MIATKRLMTMYNGIPRTRGDICKKDRQARNGHKGVVIWLTGLSGAGKSTLACALERDLFARGVHTFLLDGDQLRTGLNQNLGFDKEDRKENVRRIGEVAKLFLEAGMVVLVASISPFREDRLLVRRRFAEGEFIEIYVKCSLKECEQRDPKGLYQKARAGQISDFTGLHQPYEEPITPELIVETDRHTIEQSLSQIKEIVLSAILSFDSECSDH